MKKLAVLRFCLTVSLIIVLALTIITCQKGKNQQRDAITCYGNERLPEDIVDVDTHRKQLIKKFESAKTSADDPELIQVIRDVFLHKPRPYIPKYSRRIFRTLQAEEVDKVLHKKDGFFVECGALDGERSSNTIWLESERGWSGLLVEMDPSFYLQIRGKNRKSHSVNACLSPEMFPKIELFKEHQGGRGQVVNGDSEKTSLIHETVCFPLYSLLLALNKTEVDYFSLDVEGLELPILKTIPFDKVQIKVLTVEYYHQQNKSHVVEFMKSKGYVLHKTLHEHRPEISYYCDDYLFVRSEDMPQGVGSQ